MITRAKAIFAIVCGVFFGLMFFVDYVDWFIARNAPVVTGHVVSRIPSSRFFVPNKVDVTIRIQGSGEHVHAILQRNMTTNVPENVRFHYTGDPTRNVVLLELEHGSNPGWLVLLFFGGALILTLGMRSGHMGKALGWDKGGSHKTVPNKSSSSDR